MQNSTRSFLEKRNPAENKCLFSLFAYYNPACARILMLSLTPDILRKSRIFCLITLRQLTVVGFPGSLDGKASAYNAGDLGSIPGSGRSPGDGSGNPLQYLCLENPMDQGAWWATVHGVAKSQTRLSDFISLHTC